MRGSLVGSCIEPGRSKLAALESVIATMRKMRAVTGVVWGRVRLAHSPPPCGEGMGVGVRVEACVGACIFTPPLTPPRQGEGNPVERVSPFTPCFPC